MGRYSKRIKKHNSNDKIMILSEENDMKVEITMEKTMRIAMEFEVSKEQIEDLKCGKNPFFEQMKKEIESGEVEYDYAVNDLEGNEIVQWS